MMGHIINKLEQQKLNINAIKTQLDQQKTTTTGINTICIINSSNIKPI